MFFFDKLNINYKDRHIAYYLERFPFLPFKVLLISFFQQITLTDVS